MAKIWKVADIRATVVQNVLLRMPKESKVEEYADAMKNGVVFPPIVIGSSKKDGNKQKVLVDGLTRLMACEKAGIAGHEVREEEYATPDLLLLDMYKLNRHGAPVDVKDRDKRIVMLASDPWKWTQSRIASEFNLDQSSVSRIIGGTQKAGTATGETKSRKTFKPLTGKGIIASAMRMSKSLKLKSVKSDIAELCWLGEITDKPNPKNAERLDTLKDLYNELKGMFDYLEAKAKEK